jgi:hypothetical protein
MLCVNCLAGKVVTPLAVNFYNAHLARQTLANTFEQVHQACLYLIPALRHKNTHLTPRIPVTAVQPTRLLTDRGRKQTHVPILALLIGSLPASNGTVHLRLQRITDGYTGAVSRRRFLAYGHRFLLPSLNISAALAGYLPSHWSVKNIESTNLKGGEY